MGRCPVIGQGFLGLGSKNMRLRSFGPPWGRRTDHRPPADRKSITCGG